jgi:hypothetical protein
VIAPPFGLLVRFDAYTGLRAGELAALRVGRLDRLHAGTVVYPACTEAPVAPSGKGKGLVGDQAPLVEVGRLELPCLVIRIRPAHAELIAESGL